ncbi:MAG: hypothetical protein CSA62_00755 [Planctomycetota bacterium]|nr:MAG: hypothetical protein CSA62_00755 [Planctomycetota bacterium]
MPLCSEPALDSDPAALQDTRVNSFRILLPLALAFGPLSLSSAWGQNKVEEFRAPNGSVFLLVPRPLGTVVHWASFTSLGRIHEGPGEIGLAAASARSSLSGPAEGQELKAASRAQLTELERIAEKLWAPKPRPQASDPAELRAKLLHSWDQLIRSEKIYGFRKELASLPSQKLQVHTGVAGTLLQAQIARGRVLAFASRMERRRQQPALADLQIQLVLERERLAREAQRNGLAQGDERRSLTDEALLLALRNHPLRRTLLPRLSQAKAVSRAEALSFWHRHQRPERCVTVLVGDFDPERIREGLRRIFVRPAPGQAAPAIPDEMQQRGLRESRIQQPGPRRQVLAYRIPQGLRPGILRCLAELLASGPGSLLAELRLELGPRVQWQVQARQPELGYPAFFVIETQERGDLSPLHKRLQAATSALAKGTADPTRLEAALRLEQLRHASQREDSREYAAELARDWAMRGRAALSRAALSPKELLAGAAQLLQDARLTRVRSEPSASPSKDDE